MSLAGLITGRDVERLPVESFRNVMNTLLKVEASLHGVPLSDLNLTSKEFVSDAGIDARIKWPKEVKHDVLPAGESVIQYKTGKLTKKTFREELQKSGVRDALDAGYFYLTMSALDNNDKQATFAQKSLKAACEEQGIDPDKCRIFFAEQIATWVCRHPSVIIMPEFGKGLPAFITVAQWRKLRDLANPWKPDQPRQEIIDQVQTLLKKETIDPTIRIEGWAGVGKTRLALEAIDQAGISERAIYTTNADSSKVEELLARIQGDPRSSAIIVVDECTRDRQEVLASYARLAAGRLRLLCVGPGETPYRSPAETANLYVLGQLSPESLTDALRAAAARPLRHEVEQVAVRLAGGFVKLAFFIVDVLRRNADIPITELREMYYVRQFLRRFMDPSKLRVLEGISIFTRLGWEEALRAEAEAVANYLQVPFADFQAAVKSLKNRGVIVPRGRYIYVTPELLATDAAVELWEEQGPRLISIVPRSAGAGPTRELLKRLAMIAEHPGARRAVEMLLSEEGLFKTLGELDDEFRGELFGILASGVPGAAADVLARIIERTTRDTLRDFGKGRRNVMWAIESLLRWPESSLRAARSLRALALAENESIGNNATAIFAEYFHVRLSRSPLPFMDRLPLIDELIEADDETGRLLAVRCASAALSTFESRSGGNLDDVSGRVYPKEWRPKTWEDYWEALLAVVERLQTVSRCGTSESSCQARKALLGSVYALANVGIPNKAIEILESIEPEDDSERVEILESCAGVQKASGRPLNPEEIEKLEIVKRRAFKETYFDRLRRWIGRRPHADFEAEGKPGFEYADHMTRELAEEGLKGGVTDEEFKWLASREAINVWPFGMRLGELDADLRFLPRIVASSKDDNPGSLATSYLRGVAIARGPAASEGLLDELALNRPQLAFTCTWQSEASDSGFDRLVRLVESAAVPPEQMGFLIYGGWSVKLSGDQIAKVVDLTMRGEFEKVLEPAMGMLFQHLEKFPQSITQLEPLIWTLLEAERARARKMTEWEWGQLAERVATRDPTRMVRIVIQMFAADLFIPLEHDPALKALRAATEANSAAAWDLVGPALLGHDKIATGLIVALHQWYGELIPADTLIEWAKANQPHGPFIVARLLHVSNAPMPERARALILTFRDDKDLRTEILSNLETGGWVGPYSGYIEAKLQIVEGWTRDPDPAIRSWAAEVAVSMRKTLQRQRVLEEEGYL
jgi:hypothetical protein